MELPSLIRNSAISEAHKHIFLDLADTSESNSLAELERILDNMPEALELMKEVVELETDLRFYGSQLRDGKLPSNSLTTRG